MISLLHLHNFKCFEDQEFLLKPLTLLTGLNSTGKSSVLQSLLLLRQSYQGQSLAITSLMLQGDLVDIGVGKDALFDDAKDEEIRIGILSEGANSAKKWHFKYEPFADALDTINSSSVSYEAVYTSSLFNDNFHYLGAERIGPRDFFPASEFQVRRHRQLGSKGEYAAHFLSVFGDNDILDKRLVHKDATSLRLKHQVEAWLGEISPGVRVSLTYHPDINIVQVRYSSMLGASSGKNYRPTNVGFGVTYALPILVAILSSDPGALLLIENPEAHLHPQGQAQMGELLARAASCGIQIVVETHSDHVLNGIRVAVYNDELDSRNVQLHYFRQRKQDGLTEVISPRIDHNARFDQWPDGFFDQWDKSLEALLEPKDV